MANLEKLIISRAYWATEKARLKAEGAAAYHQCENEGRCFGIAIARLKEVNDTPYDEFTFDEIWVELREEARVCCECDRARTLKAARMRAGTKLGQIHGALTRAGWALVDQEADHAQTP